MPSPSTDLDALLRTLFADTGELRAALLRRLDDSDTVLSALPGPNSPLDDAITSVRALIDAEERFGPSLFAALAEHAPDRKADIAAVAAKLAEGSDPAAHRAGRHEIVRVLHLSDLHARARTQWDAEPLLVRLVEEVAALRQAGLGADLVAFTGDLAHSGKPEEYELVERWLRHDLLPAAGLTAEDLLIVPGNHDVDRDRCKSVAITALESALRDGDQDVIAQVLRAPADLGLLHERYEAFKHFLRRLGVAHAREPSWRFERRVRGVALQIAGLDTAWLSSVEPAQGRLVLGLAALNRVLPAGPQGDVVLALAHHPLTWLVDQDYRAVWPPLRARADVLLRGHLHHPDPVAVTPPHQQILELAAGSAYAGSSWPNSIQLIEIDPTRNEVRAHVRVWSAARDRWVAQRTELPPDGVAHFALRRADPAQPRAR